jgi:membrane fusion protein, multidrug efflux system
MELRILEIVELAKCSGLIGVQGRNCAIEHCSRFLGRAELLGVNCNDTRRATLGLASADVHAAEAALATAKLNLDFTEVRSPIAGRVSRTLLTLGNLVQADRTVLTSVVSQDPVYVYFQPDEQSFLRYRELAATANAPTRTTRCGWASPAKLAFRILAR